jgi:hypothetical protein
MGEARQADRTIFFSYTRRDGEFALKLAEDLRGAGIPIWIDQLDIPVGTRWDEQVQAALLSTRWMLLILSPESVESENVLDEIAYALDHDIAVIPVLLRECRLPLRVARIQYIDFTGSYDDAVVELLDHLRMLGGFMSLPPGDPRGQMAQPTDAPRESDGGGDTTGRMQRARSEIPVTQTVVPRRSSRREAFSRERVRLLAAGGAGGGMIVAAVLWLVLPWIQHRGESEVGSAAAAVATLPPASAPAIVAPEPAPVLAPAPAPPPAAATSASASAGANLSPPAAIPRGGTRKVPAAPIDAGKKTSDTAGGLLDPKRCKEMHLCP